MIIGNHSDDKINNEVKQKIHWLRPELKMKINYQLINCADLLVLPSILDNLPQIKLEAQACGLPINHLSIMELKI